MSKDSPQDIETKLNQITESDIFSDQEKEWRNSIGNEKDLWEPEGHIAQELAASLPGEREVESLWDLEFREHGAELDYVRGIINFRRKVLHRRWVEMRGGV